MGNPASVPPVPTVGAIVQSWLQPVRDLGFPVVVAAVLLYNLLVTQPQQQADLVAAVREAVQRLDRIDQAQQRILDALRSK